MVRSYGLFLLLVQQKNAHLFENLMPADLQFTPDKITELDTEQLRLTEIVTMQSSEIAYKTNLRNRGPDKPIMILSHSLFEF
jgi:hypothetical protein